MTHDELGRLVGIPVFVASDADAVSREVARRIAKLVRRRAAEGRRPVLGLATGSTPRGVYRELIRMHTEEGLDLSDVVTFNLDEYYPMDPESPHSYHRYMRAHFFDHVDVADEGIHIPRGDLPRTEVDAHCVAYERAIVEAGGVDLQLLGIGRDGHIGFNEPGSTEDSRTRLVRLHAMTRADAADDFGGLDNVPHEAITMGVATILDARAIVLMALGAGKSEVVYEAATAPPRPSIVATFLQRHPAAAMILDFSAAEALTRAFRATRAGPAGARA